MRRVFARSQRCWWRHWNLYKVRKRSLCFLGKLESGECVGLHVSDVLLTSTGRHTDTHTQHIQTHIHSQYQQEMRSHDCTHQCHHHYPPWRWTYNRHAQLEQWSRAGRWSTVDSPEKVTLWQLYREPAKEKPIRIKVGNSKEKKARGNSYSPICQPATTTVALHTNVSLNKRLWEERYATGDAIFRPQKVLFAQ